MTSAGAPSAFRSVILPLLVPAIAAGSIFTFSLSLGDYITVKIVGSKTQLIGNLIERTLRERPACRSPAFHALADRDHGRLPDRHGPTRRLREPVTSR